MEPKKKLKHLNSGKKNSNKGKKLGDKSRRKGKNVRKLNAISWREGLLGKRLASNE